MIGLAPHFTQREFRWPQWKVMQRTKNFVFQHFESSDSYTIWGYDGPEVIITHIWKDSVPAVIVESGYSQEQNDLDRTDFETNYLPYSNGAISGQSAFASKKFGAKRLFKRIHGALVAVDSNSSFIFSNPYSWAKITELEIIGGELGDTVSLYVLDTPSGLISGSPNLRLNQFGFQVCIAPSFYEYKSEFDADLYENMQIELIYSSVSAKTIGVNFILNEVK